MKTSKIVLCRASEGVFWYSRVDTLTVFLYSDFP